MFILLGERLYVSTVQPHHDLITAHGVRWLDIAPPRNYHIHPLYVNPMLPPIYFIILPIIPNTHIPIRPFPSIYSHNDMRKFYFVAKWFLNWTFCHWKQLCWQQRAQWKKPVFITLHCDAIALTRIQTI
jgi:hypothetical protein